MKSEKSAEFLQRQGPPNALEDSLTQMPTSQLCALSARSRDLASDFRSRLDSFDSLGPFVLLKAEYLGFICHQSDKKRVAMFYVGQKQSQEETGAKAFLTGGSAGSPSKMFIMQMNNGVPDRNSCQPPIRRISSAKCHLTGEVAIR